MRRLVLPFTLALAIAACNSGSTGKKTDEYKSDDNPVVPATPGGTFTVTILDRDKDTSAVRFNFTFDTLKYERTFNDLPLIKGYPDSAIYKVFWDEPNSVWVGFIKPNRDTRYYHGSQDKASLKINWVPSPPRRIYQFMEKVKGLGDAIRQQEMLQQYDQELKSGQIIAHFIVKLQDAEKPGSKNVYIEYGGIRRVLELPVPKGAKPYIQSVAEDHCVVGLLMPDGEKEDYYEVKVVNGRIGYKQVQTALNIK
ncbi:hypothetical protein ACFOTA_24375 [Chitinophaga sp. GCM10012297]|uniref:Uncharacterized protein n=1 Tax=Chitinophaga chungangae TaxID=2821488 RepID=A0ABS3YL22_9BACT|nr:hypothetical protein [Chitinophaga chungangae]MBO9155370.1 hypothetical protein [Chitinophaga chungangae]